MNVDVGPASLGMSTPVALSPRTVDWDRVWTHHPSDVRDDALLERERRGPRWEVIVEKLETALGAIRGLRTIELGSGRGDWSALLAERGAEVTLVDQSDRALAQAEHRFRRLGLTARFLCGDLMDAGCAGAGLFHVVLSSGVIEHFRGEDRSRALRSHLERLVPGGVAVISVPNAWCIPYRMWKLYLERRGWWPYGTEIPYGRRELTHRARQVGFRRIESQCMGLWQSVGDHWVRPWLRRRVDWSRRRSVLDKWMGFMLLLFGWRGGE